jgi:hypothetical protein
MKRKVFQVALPATIVVAMVAFFSTILLGTANPAFAATGKKKAPAVVRLTAVEHTEARIGQLESALKLTADQQALWSNLTLVMRDNAKNMDALTKDRALNKKVLNTVEYMKYQNQIFEARSEQMKRFIPPFEALYASLSDEQKTTTDALFMTGKHGKHRMK